MSDAALSARFFEPVDCRPAWLRPAAITLVVVIHAAALSTLPFLATKPPEPPREIIVDVEPGAPPPEAPKELEVPPAAALTPLPQDVQLPPPPPPVAEASPPGPAPPVVEASPPVSMSRPPPPEAPPTPPPETPPPPPVEPAPAPPKPPPRVEPAKPQVKPTPKPEAETGPPSGASAASQSAYVSAMAAAIRSHLFYPPAARARGVKGVVGVVFAIGPSGALASFAITRSSGDADLDAAARTLVQSTHFPPPPGGAVRVSTSFNYVPR